MPLAPITEILFFVSEDSRGLFVMSSFKPLKQDGQQSLPEVSSFPPWYNAPTMLPVAGNIVGALYHKL